MNMEDVKTNTATVTAVVETPKSVTTPAQIKSPIDFGNTGVQIRTMEDAFRFATCVVKAGLAPKGFESPEAVVIALQHAAELGLSPMQGLQSVAVINGRPCIYGDAALALVRRSGLLENYDQRIEGEGDKRAAVVIIKRKGEPERISRFSVDDAKVAKLWMKKGRNGEDTPWCNYPERMMLFRARGFALRDSFGDVLKGLRTVEEVRDFPEERNVTPLSEKVSGGLTAALTNGGAA